jgi:NAD-dependent SIR2 family protein deacetylase
MAENNEKIEQFRSMIEQSSRGVIFTGAGISTEPGIPDLVLNSEIGPTLSAAVDLD